MFQRPGRTTILPVQKRGEADELLQVIGGYEAMNTDITHWLARKPGQLELVGPRMSERFRRKPVACAYFSGGRLWHCVISCQSRSKSLA